MFTYKDSYNECTSWIINVSLKGRNPGYTISAWISMVRKLGIMPGHTEKMKCNVTVFVILVIKFRVNYKI